jgi:hydrogenase maturation protein HypF
MTLAAPERTRLKARVCGAVQGVGFRPFVFRLAAELGLAGWINNSPQGVVIEVEGSRPALEQFLLRLAAERPPRSFIQSLEASWLDAVGHTGFEIRESETGGDKTALVLPDIATCPECLREILDPSNRRHRYPFTNCTNCGPRFSIIESLPYDRANTSMKVFAMCPQCQAEYDNPHDRRFHAQPNACPACGPHLELWNAGGDALFACQEALLAAANAIRRGRIVALKGVGGFHLMVDARNDVAIRRLRERKHREEKPLALMFPSLESVKAACEVRPLEEIGRAHV